MRDDAENIQEIKWNAYGKISSITRTGNNNKSNLEFGYDASGQRLWKTVKPRVNGVQSTQKDWTTTWYIRDASGNPIATYNEKYKEQAGNGGNTEFVDEIMLIEQAIFAANRVGVIAPKKVIAQVTKTMIATGGLYDVQGKARLGAVTSSTSATVNTTRMDFYLGRKNYELSNHLGNVLAVVSDRKQMVDDGTYLNGLKANGIMDNISDYYQAEYQSFGMYYAYGAPLPGRGYTATNFNGYRFGFNGMESNFDIASSIYEGDEYRYIDTRLGRWTSVDQAETWYPENSPYNAMGNNPIFFVDPEGLWHREKRESGKQKEEYLVADKGDDLESLEKYLNKRRNRNRFTDDQKIKVREAVQKQIENSSEYRDFTTGPNILVQQGNTDGFEINLTHSLELYTNVYVGVNDQSAGGQLYNKLGGHVGINFDGTWYHYYYSKTTKYHNDQRNKDQFLHALMIYKGKTYSTDKEPEYFRTGGTHFEDVYFAVPLSTQQYFRLNRTLQKYSSGDKRSPNYGFFGKRCTSMANHYLRKSGIKLAGWNFIQRKANTLFPGAYYKRMVRLGFTPIKVVP